MGYLDEDRMRATSNLDTKHVHLPDMRQSQARRVHVSSRFKAEDQF